jgi:hypothetical protein
MFLPTAANQPNSGYARHQFVYVLMPDRRDIFSSKARDIARVLRDRFPAPAAGHHQFFNLLVQRGRARRIGREYGLWDYTEQHEQRKRRHP